MYSVKIFFILLITFIPIVWAYLFFSPRKKKLSKEEINEKLIEFNAASYLEEFEKFMKSYNAFVNHYCESSRSDFAKQIVDIRKPKNQIFDDL